MTKTHLFFTAVLLTSVVLATPVLAADGIKIALKSADSGNFLGRCNNCVPGGSYPDNAFVHVKPSELAKAHWAHWVITKIGDGKYRLAAADTGNLLSRCNNCIPGGAYPDNASVHVKPSDNGRFAQWHIEMLSDGKYALRVDDSGNYLGRCNNCVPKGAYIDSAFVHVKPSELKGAHWAHWEIVFLP